MKKKIIIKTDLRHHFILFFFSVLVILNSIMGTICHKNKKAPTNKVFHEEMPSPNSQKKTSINPIESLESKEKDIAKLKTTIPAQIIQIEPITIPTNGENHHENNHLEIQAKYNDELLKFKPSMNSRSSSLKVFPKNIFCVKLFIYTRNFTKRRMMSKKLAL